MTDRERLAMLLQETSCLDVLDDEHWLVSADELLANGVIVLDTDHVKTAIRKMTPQFVLCPKGWEGFKKTRYYCPQCKKMTREHEKFCHTCGQAVKYPKLARSKTDNKLFLDWSDTK